MSALTAGGPASSASCAFPSEDCCQALSFPPALKYESDGGPGILSIMQLLKGSDDPEHDLRMFLKAQIVLWLLGAIDGHAKNFSI